RNPLLQEADAPGRDAPLPGLDDFLRARQRHAQAGGRMIPGAPPRGAGASGAASRGAASHSEWKTELETTLADAPTLTDHLEAQLDLASADPQLRAIGRHVIHALDEAGYLAEPLNELAGRLRVPTASAEAALRLVQTFEPPGV